MKPGGQLKRTPLSRGTVTLQPGKPLSRTAPIARVSEKRAAEIVAGAVKTAATRRSAPRSARAESFPPAVAALIDARDPWCVKCGSPDNLHRHHRRLKGYGGDPRPHTDCACNGVRLCRHCHLDWAHGEGRSEAEGEGVIIPRSETEPGRRSLMVHTAADSGATLLAYVRWPLPD